MFNFRRRIKQLNRERDGKIAQATRHIQHGYDLTSEHERESCREAVAGLDRIYPELILKPRTRVWWVRSTLASIPLYVAIALMAHAMRHPDLTETQRFLAFWDAMLWR